MTKGSVKVSKRKYYRWIDLPKDAVIIQVVKADDLNFEIQYESESGIHHECDANFGFECNIFEIGQEIALIQSKEHEREEIVYATTLNYDNERLVVIITRWRKIEDEKQQ